MLGFDSPGPVQEVDVVLVNLTPHPVVVYAQDRNEVILELPSVGQARCQQVDRQIGTVVHGSLEIPLYQSVYGEVSGLPEPKPGVIYIVSALAAQAVRGQRDDVVVPSQPVRDADGRVIGCRAFARL